MLIMVKTEAAVELADWEMVAQWNENEFFLRWTRHDEFRKREMSSFILTSARVASSAMSTDFTGGDIL